MIPTKKQCKHKTLYKPRDTQRVCESVYVRMPSNYYKYTSSGQYIIIKDNNTYKAKNLNMLYYYLYIINNKNKDVISALKNNITIYEILYTKVYKHEHLRKLEIKRFNRRLKTI